MLDTTWDQPRCARVRPYKSASYKQPRRSGDRPKPAARSSSSCAGPRKRWGWAKTDPKATRNGRDQPRSGGNEPDVSSLQMPPTTRSSLAKRSSRGSTEENPASMCSIRPLSGPTLTLMCRVLEGCSRLCRWPRTLTQPSGTFRSGMWVNSKGAAPRQRTACCRSRRSRRYRLRRRD